MMIVSFYFKLLIVSTKMHICEFFDQCLPILLAFVICIPMKVLLNLCLCYRKEDAGMRTTKMIYEKEVLDKELNADVEGNRSLEENMQQLHSRGDEI
jgi:hypothetical protein